MTKYLWQCFEQTGHINNYLGYKEYESIKNSLAESENDVIEIENIEE